MGTGHLLALVAMLSWGLIVLAIKNTRVPGRLGVAISMFVGTLTMLPALFIFDSGDLSLPAILGWPGFFAVLGGFCQFPVATTAYYESIRAAEVSTVVPVARTKGMIVLLMVIALGVETVTWTIGIAFILGVGGAVILTCQKPKTELQRAQSGNVKKGVALALLASLAWAAGDLLMQQSMRGLPAVHASLLALVSGMAIYYIFLLATGKFTEVLRVPLRDKLLYAAHGVVSIGIGFLAFFASIRMIGVAKAAIISEAWPAIAFIAGLTVLRERITIAKIIGFVLIMASVIMVMPR